MLLPDRDILAEIEKERVQLDPFDPAMVQPSSLDVRLDRFFRVFENHKCPHIDPSVDQPDLTRQVEPQARPLMQWLGTGSAAHRRGPVRPGPRRWVQVVSDTERVQQEEATVATAE